MGKYSPEYMNKRIQEPMTIQIIDEAIKNKDILEGKVICCDSNHTLTLELGKNILGKITSEDFEYVIDGSKSSGQHIEYAVYKHLKFIPLSSENDNGVTVVKCSRKLAQEECFNNYIKKLHIGDIIDATVSRINRYGVFCDIGCGICALLPINNLSVTHVIDPNEFLLDTYNIKAVVKKIDDNNRIQLTHKELLGTWKEEASDIKKNSIICGIVLSVEKYGVFIRISQNLSGLAEPTNIDLETNDKVLVRVTFIKEESMKIKLVVISKLDDTAKEQIHNSFNYRIEDNHISEWHYSVPGAKKQIDSYFK